MCRPKLPNVMSSGWHLHQSLRDREGANAFVDDQEPLSAVGRHYMAGLLEHAHAAAAFSTPTLNGYKRYRPHSLAPDRAIWGRDNRGVMVRALGGPGDPATHLENRVGEPAANPYLYMASQVVSGLDGLRRKSTPAPRPIRLTRPRRRFCRGPWPKLSRRCAPTPSCAPASAISSSTTTSN
jgi:glutamine synthetase